MDSGTIPQLEGDPTDPTDPTLPAKDPFDKIDHDQVLFGKLGTTVSTPGKKTSHRELKDELKKYRVTINADAREKLINTINNDVDGKLLTLSMILAIHKKLRGSAARINMHDVDLAQIIMNLVRGKVDMEKVLSNVRELADKADFDDLI